jgi:hypothetical protein
MKPLLVTKQIPRDLGGVQIENATLIKADAYEFIASLEIRLMLKAVVSDLVVKKTLANRAIAPMEDSRYHKVCLYCNVTVTQIAGISDYQMMNF